VNAASEASPALTLMRDLPCEERPRERLGAYGPGALSTAELLAILFRTGTAKESALALASRVLADRGGLVGLAKTSLAELLGLRGLGEAKACELLAALELGRRVASAAPEDRPVIRVPDDVVRLLQPEMALLDREHLRVILLDTRCRVIAAPEVYRGTVNVTLIRTSELLREAVVRNAPNIIVVHNHPSGDPAPSPDDIRLTRQLAEAAVALDIDLLDHVILGQGEGRWVSLKQRTPSLFRTAAPRGEPATSQSAAS
jgi:DNA repair protein RadC